MFAVLDAKREEQEAKAGRRRGGLADLLSFATQTGATVTDQTKASSN